MSNIITDSLFKNAIVFFNDAIYHFNRWLENKAYADQILSIVNTQMALELAMKYKIAETVDVRIIFEAKSIHGLSIDQIYDAFQNNELRINEFEQLKNYMKSNKKLSTTFSSHFAYMDKFQNYRNKLVHQNYTFTPSEINQIENDIIHIFIYIIVEMLTDISAGEKDIIITDLINSNEYKKLLANYNFAEKLNEKAKSDYGKLYYCPICDIGLQTMLPYKRCYRCGLIYNSNSTSVHASNAVMYVKCHFCGETMVAFDDLNIDDNHGFARGLCLNCGNDTIIFKCPKCGEYYDTETCVSEFCTPDKCIIFDT